MIGPALGKFLAEDRGRCLAALTAEFRDLDLAEEALSAAVEAAVTAWQAGLPRHPAGWILAAARRRAIDQLRQRARHSRVLGDPAIWGADGADAEDSEAIPDERLRLIFTCCHPALDSKSRVALTLRALGGLTTAEIARAFLDSEAAMGQRLSRAKAKIRAAGIAYEVPGPTRWAERLASVLSVIYLIFNEGYSRTRGDAPLRVDLCDEAIWLGRTVDMLRPGEAEVIGLLSLMLTSHARRFARSDADGAMVALEDQDRSLWDRGMAAEGIGLLDRAMALGAPGPFQIKAAISALHIEAVTPAATDWRQIVLLYDALLIHEPSPVVRLNRAVALCSAGAPEAALTELDALAGDLASYQPFHAAHADLLARAGRADAARIAYAHAVALSGTEVERQFLRGRKDALGDAG